MGKLEKKQVRSFWTLRVEHVDALPTTDIDPHNLKHTLNHLHAKQKEE